MRPLVFLLLVVTLIDSSSAAPGDGAPAKLSGTYSIGTASLIDPTMRKENDVLLRLYLTGRSARDLYNALSSKPRRDECFEDGTLTKVSGELMCARHPKGSHECWLGIDLKKHVLAPGFVC